MKIYKKILLTLFITVITCAFSSCQNDLDPMAGDFAFSLTWNTYGVSSYDSATGKLVKTTDATYPEDYITELILTGEEISAIYDLITELNVYSYPDEYNPNPDMFMEPPTTLILKVTENGKEKIIKAEDISTFVSTADGKGRKFLKTCEEISKILTSSEEWKALPDYEFHYE